MITLESLLGQSNMKDATANLAKEFIALFQLPAYQQLAFCVESSDKASEAIEKHHQTHPFLLSEAELPVWIECGLKKSFIGRVALGYVGDYQLEFLEKGVGSDFYGQLLSRPDETRLHHLGFFVEDLKPYTKSLEQAGMSIYVVGKSIVGPIEIDFHYMDTFAELGFYIEFICFSVAGKSFIPEQSLIDDLALKQREKARNSYKRR